MEFPVYYARCPTHHPGWLKLLKYDLFNVLNVPSHRRLRSLTIVAFNRSQDPAVAGERLLWASFQLQRAFPGFPQQVHQNIEHFEHDTVSGSQSHAVMKFGVLGNTGFAT